MPEKSDRNINVVKIYKKYWRSTNTCQIRYIGGVYKIAFEIEEEPSMKNVCSVCDKEPTKRSPIIWTEILLGVYQEILEVDNMIPLSANSKRGKEIIEILKKNIFSKPLCTRCFNRKRNARSERLSFHKS